MVIKDRYQHAKKTPAAQFILFSWREYNSLSFDGYYFKRYITYLIKQKLWYVLYLHTYYSTDGLDIQVWVLKVPWRNGF